MYVCLYFSTSSLSFSAFCVLNTRHSNCKEMESQCSFDLHFLNGIFDLYLPPKFSLYSLWPITSCHSHPLAVTYFWFITVLYAILECHVKANKQFLVIVSWDFAFFFSTLWNSANCSFSFRYSNWKLLILNLNVFVENYKTHWIQWRCIFLEENISVLRWCTWVRID